KLGKRAWYLMAGVVLITALSQLGCSEKPIRLIADPYSGQVILNPDKGQVLRWDSTMSAYFLAGASPCKSGGDPNECTINVNSGMYLWKCKNNACVDPQVVVGSDTAAQVMGVHVSL